MKYFKLKFLKTVCVVAVFIPAVVNAQTDSVVSAENVGQSDSVMSPVVVVRQPDSLESEYSLGRVTEPNVMSNVAALTMIDNVGYFGNQLFNQWGKDNRFQVGMSFLVMPVFSKDFGFLFQIPALSWHVKPSDGNVIAVDVAGNLLATNFSFSNGFTGISQGGSTYNASVKWNFLSHGGKIAVESDMYDIAFYCGPQVNGGQFGFKSDLQIASFADISFQRSSGIAAIYPVYGITDNQQLSGKVAVISNEKFPGSSYTLPSALPA